MYHWNDQYYEAECAECGTEIFGKTIAEMDKQASEHACSQPG